MRVNAKASTITCSRRCLPELRLANCRDRASHNRGSISQMARGLQRGCTMRHSSRCRCKGLAHGRAALGVHMADVVGIWACLEASMKYDSGREGINLILLNIGIGLGELSGHVSHQRLGTRVNVFGVVFTKHLLMNHH